MVYLIIFLILITLLLVYPFKIKIYNKNNYLFINIKNILNLKLNLLALIYKLDNIDLEKQKKNAKVMKKIKIKEINLKVTGLNFDYRLNGAFYGLSNAIMGFLKSFSYQKDLKFNYVLEYMGEKNLLFNGKIKVSLINVVWAFLKI